ncbi:MAG: ABC transporter ATP-binding protein, partial [[Clostridium] innocuum]
DIVGKEALEEALNGYTGTILFVSHDRYFIKKIATAILHIDMQGKAVYYPFGYDQFDEDQQEKEKEQAPKKDAEIQRQTPKRNPNAREAAKLEKQIAEKEEQLEELRQKRFDPEYYHDYQKMNELDEQIDDLHNEIEHLMQRWEECLEG